MGKFFYRAKGPTGIEDGTVEAKNWEEARRLILASGHKPDDILSLSNHPPVGFTGATEDLVRIPSTESLDQTLDLPSSSSDLELTQDLPPSSSDLELTQDLPPSSSDLDLTQDLPSSTSTPPLELTEDLPTHSTPAPELTQDPPELEGSSQLATPPILGLGELTLATTLTTGLLFRALYHWIPRPAAVLFPVFLLSSLVAVILSRRLPPAFSRTRRDPQRGRFLLGAYSGGLAVVLSWSLISILYVIYVYVEGVRG